MSKIIIMGSSRSNGHTRQAVLKIFSDNHVPFVDLLDLNIGHYDYAYQNQSDDFISLVDQVLNHETIILATPVYWYTMSALMKIFMDRISDLLDVRKDLGRQLRGKKMFVIASYGTSLPRGFEDGFEQTCEYLGIRYLGTSFIYSGTENVACLANNTIEIMKAKQILL